MKDIRPSLLIFLSAGLIITWIYHLYDKSQYSSRTREVYIKDSLAVAEAVSDSLKRFFSDEIEKLESDKLNIDSANSSLQGELKNRMNEIISLRNEIRTILQRKNISQADLIDAREKINELQTRISLLRNENSSLSEEQQKLTTILDQLNGEINSLQLSITKYSNENEALRKKINEASTFVASNIRFVAVQVRSDQRETETNSLKRAGKFVISFSLQNNATDFNTTELYVIIKDPEGKTISPEIWDAGSFETRLEGKRAYTRKMKLEYTMGEVKEMIFSLKPDVFEKGTYNFYLYHNGIRIGTSSITLT